MRFDAATLGLAFSAVSTLVVVVGAIAAVRQLQHLRRANELSAISKFVDEWSSPAFEADRLFVRRELPVIMRDPTTFFDNRRTDPRMDRVLRVAHFFERLAFLVEREALSEELAMFLFGIAATATWDMLREFIVAMRAYFGTPIAMEYFEDFALRADDWTKRENARPKQHLRRDPKAAAPSGEAL